MQDSLHPWADATGYYSRIKQDISSSSPQVNISTTTQITAPIIAKGFKGITQKLFDERTISAQYPENWKGYISLGDFIFYDTSRKTADNKNKLQLSISLVDDHNIKDGNAYVATSSRTFEAWVRANFENNSVHLEKTTISGNETWKITDNSNKNNCANWWLLYHNGLVFLLAVTDDACSANSKIIDNIINSVSFNDADIDRGAFNPIYWSRGVERSDDKDDEEYSILSNKALIVQNDPLKTIKIDYRLFYERDTDIVNFKNKFIFKIPTKTIYGCSVYYLLDMNIRKYRESVTQLCGTDIDKDQTTAFVIQERYGFTSVFDDSKDELKKSHNIYVINLLKDKEFLVYTKRNDSESLISECVEQPAYEGYFPNYTHDVEMLTGDKLRIGVYKNVGQDTKDCTEETLGKYEKIRDDIVDLNKF